MHLQSYIEDIQSGGKDQLASAVLETAAAIAPQYIQNFSYREHVVSLLLGNIQSGKTSHMFALMAAAADEGFNIFVLLTTDSINLQRQTQERAENELTTFDIFGEDDYLKFVQCSLKKPMLIVLKKNFRVLKNWKNNFATTNFCAGNPLFIVDDEADAASLNTLVNKKSISPVNKILGEMKRTSSSSIYMQVTGTPQAILLQSTDSSWNPHFIHYFKPGIGYIGGDFFFSSEEESPYIILTENDEADELLADDEFAENHLKYALHVHLISSAHIFITGIGMVCNFIVHPSVKTDQHEKFAEKIGDYLNDLSQNIETVEGIGLLKQAYENLNCTKPDLISFDRVYNFIKDLLENDQINILIMNSNSKFMDAHQYEKGINIIIGGNILGRGITFPKLQTIYYCRQSKHPQADTIWQHSRIFGYDREPGLMRLFLPPVLFKLFIDLNKINNVLVAQVMKYTSDSKLSFYYPSGVRPTRPQVLDKLALAVITGGVNYFPFYPTNQTAEMIDSMLVPFGKENYYSVNLKLIAAILKYTGSESDDWDSKGFIAFVNSFIASKSNEQGILIVRRERDIAKGTGTLLSPNDRTLVQSFSDQIVLTMYKVTGAKGWNGQKIWIPNLKFPDGLVFYNTK